MLKNVCYSTFIEYCIMIMIERLDTDKRDASASWKTAQSISPGVDFQATMDARQGF